MSRAWIIGAGVVGEATGRALTALGSEVSFVDRSSDRLTTLSAEGWAVAHGLADIAEGDAAVVCVPTPASRLGYDLTELLDAVAVVGQAVASLQRRFTLVIRSTVPPGTCAGVVRATINQWVPPADSSSLIPVVHFPEYLREASALEDAIAPRHLVVGSEDEVARSEWGRLAGAIGAPVTVFDSAAAAELAKCAHNAFNATKISFFNEITAIAQALGVDAAGISGAVSRTAEASWNPNYGIRGGTPYGGKCLPKDLLGLISSARALGIDPVLLAAVDERNRLTGATQA